MQAQGLYIIKLVWNFIGEDLQYGSEVGDLM